MSSSDTPLLAVDGLGAGYSRGADVLHGVSITVGAGEVVSLLGRNGAGKTTILKTLSGLLPRTTGTIALEGREITPGSSPETIARLGVAHVPEGRRVFSGLTVEENLEVGGLAAGIEAKVRRDDVAHVYDLFPPLAKLKGRSAWALSGGEQQMVAVGRALCSHPRLMLMDEPSLGLAPLVVRTVLDAIAQIATEGIGVLLVEQNVELAAQISHRSYLLDEGRVTSEFDAERAVEREALLSAYLGDTVPSEDEA